ncbi:hypothetical protein [uncultured Flavobacterium sp.]|uniref:toxin-antitoxin system YwqK family antitoxin n=1 Tax=uncultured Flavobacterium sp. TaxID=165435 RepID=UPI002599559C|nr:hypothetical protein [uncultured Flavobacterium sp.]
MKKIFILYMFFVTFTTVAQDWYPNDGYEFQIRMPEIRNLENFFYNEWELNPAEISFKLSDIEMLKKTNSHENIRYEITKNKLGITTVSIYVNTRIYSEAMYKNGVLEGKKTIYHVNGSTFQEINFKNGKANGAYNIYDDEYHLVIETHYKDNLKNGIRRYTYPNRDKKILEGNYVNGNLVGNLKYYEDNDVFILPNDMKKGKVQRFINNKLISEYNIVNSRDIHGEAKIYNYETGNLSVKIPYYLGEKHGVVTFYNTKGEITSNYEYSFGKKIGEHKTYSKDKKLIKEEYYDAQGLKIGTWKNYNASGELEREQKYKNDSLNGASITYRNGKITSSTEYKNNKKNGLTIYNKDNQQKSSEVIYENDELVKETAYYANQAIFYIQERDKTTGAYNIKYYDKTGKLLHENKYNDKNLPIGINKFYTLKDDEANSNSETHYDVNGKKIKYIYKMYGGGTVETNYRNELMHGVKIIFDEKTNTETKEYYYESKGNSKKVTQEEFENLVKGEKK